MSYKIFTGVIDYKIGSKTISINIRRVIKMSDTQNKRLIFI